MALIYPGLIPMNVSKDAKYSVVHGPDGMEIRLIFQVNRGERAILTTDKHEELVNMVNAVKTEVQASLGGAFYINEYFDVVVPAGDGQYFAGCYNQILRFELDGLLVSPKASPDLQPGDPWAGPHVGIRYTLSASGTDIFYKYKTGNREIRHDLSQHVGIDPAEKLASRLTRIKGPKGGRIYINECGEFFAPVEDADGRFLYLGTLGEDAWFPAPNVPRD
ncbi:MAG: hypothetical protein EXQ69_09425 [Acidimicrobiia bacterium]|nr:hypothetical protein [Acidimicrobiia bacterium]